MHARTHHDFCSHSESTICALPLDVIHAQEWARKKIHHISIILRRLNNIDILVMCFFRKKERKIEPAAKDCQCLVCCQVPPIATLRRNTWHCFGLGTVYSYRFEDELFAAKTR